MLPALSSLQNHRHRHPSPAVGNSLNQPPVTLQRPPIAREAADVAAGRGEAGGERPLREGSQPMVLAGFPIPLPSCSSQSSRRLSWAAWPQTKSSLQPRLPCCG